MQSRILTKDRMGNAGYHQNGKPNWWARVGDNFLDIPKVRGDQRLHAIVDVPPGTLVHCGAGKGKVKTIRESVRTIALDAPLPYPYIDVWYEEPNGEEGGEWIVSIAREDGDNTISTHADEDDAKQAAQVEAAYRGLIVKTSP